LETITTFIDKSSYPARADIDTTLFVSSAESLINDLFEESKIHFARAVSLYHSLNAHHMCAQWSDLFMSILHLKHTSSPSLEDSDHLHVLLGQVMTVKAYSLSMSGSHASGVSRYERNHVCNYFNSFSRSFLLCSQPIILSF